MCRSSWFKLLVVTVGVVMADAHAVDWDFGVMVATGADAVILDGIDKDTDGQEHQQPFKWASPEERHWSFVLVSHIG